MMDLVDWSAVAPLVASIVTAAISAGAALYAAASAARARASEAEAGRLRELEQRLSAKKVEIYEQILKTLGDMLVPEEMRNSQAVRGKSPTKADPLAASLFEFMNRVIIYGSDEVLQAFSRFRLASGSNPPPLVTMRLVSDFMLAIRRDLDGGRTKVTGVELIGMRINDFYSETGLVEALTEPFEAVCRSHSWSPPWAASSTGAVLDTNRG